MTMCMTIQEMFDHTGYKDTRNVDSILVAGDGVQMGPHVLSQACKPAYTMVMDQNTKSACSAS